METARRWPAAAATVPADASARRLADVLEVPQGLPFAVRFIDGVIRPENARTAAREFAALTKDPPGFLPWHLRVAYGVTDRRNRCRLSC